MTPEEALSRAQEAMRTKGGYSYTNHFMDRLHDRDARVGDVMRAIRTATWAEQQPNGSWRLYGGKDTDEVDLVPVVEFLNGGTIRLLTIIDSRNDK